MHGADETGGELGDAFAVLGGAGDDFVVYVGDVAYVGEGVADVF